MSDFLKVNVDELDNAEAQQQSLPVADVGEFLRSQRLKRKWSQIEVANELKIEVRQLNALENNQFEFFPGSVFVQGYIKNYAKLLEIDPGPIIKEFNEVSKIKTPEIVPIKRVMTSAGGGSQIPLSKFSPVILGIVTIVLVLWLGDNLYSFIKDMGQETEVIGVENGLAKIDVLNRFQQAQERQSDSAESLDLPQASKPILNTDPPAIQSAPEVATNIAPLESVESIEIEPVIETPAKVSVVFRFKQDSWIEVIDANQARLIARIGQAGSEKIIEGVPPLRVVLGNAVGVDVELEGKSYPFRISERTQVARFTLGRTN